MRCPECGSELIEVGYPDETGFQQYRCPNGCNFKPPLSWRIWNFIGATLYIITIVVCLVVFFILAAAYFTVNGIRGVFR